MLWLLRRLFHPHSRAGLTDAERMIEDLDRRTDAVVADLAAAMHRTAELRARTDRLQEQPRGGGRRSSGPSPVT